MRGSLGRKLPNPNLTRNSFIPSSFSFSTSSGRGRGRGGGAGGADRTNFGPARVPGQPFRSEDSNESDSSGGFGHGSGKPIPSTPFLPSFSAFTSAGNVAPSGRGAGRVTTNQPTDSHPQPPDSSSQFLAPKQPIFFRRSDESGSIPKPQDVHSGKSREDNALPSSMLSVLSRGAGRGKIDAKQPSPPEQQVKEDNRHFRPPRPAAPGRGRGPPVVTDRDTPKLSRDDAVKKAVSILTRGGGASEEGGGRGGSIRGRARGRGRSRGAAGWRGRGGRKDRRDEDEEDEDGGLYLGDDADGEKLANSVGPDVMNKLVEAFEEMSYKVLPSPEMDCYVDALDTNLAIECEPEYMFEEFGTNPDIDEKPPIPLWDALEKMKPFLMAYENIQSHEEWEEAIKDLMDRVPLLKEIVDHYSGPDRVTAKKQNEELERVAKTLPERAPASVQKFTNRALLSLQSNPGWGFDKKCQFMDKLVWEVSQQYK